MQIVAADIGGTHARFALAELRPGARPIIGEMRKYRTREYAGLSEAWARFGRDNVGDLPRAAALAVAAPIEGDTLTFMNSDWRIDRNALKSELGLDRLSLLNDFGAVAHSV
jgi:glucokinase